MFLVLHTSGLILIPLSIITYRLAAGSTEATSVFIPCVAGTVITTLASIFVVSFKQKLKWDFVLSAWLAWYYCYYCCVLFFVSTLMSAEQEILSAHVSGNLVLLIFIVAIFVAGYVKKFPCLMHLLKVQKKDLMLY